MTQVRIALAKLLAALFLLLALINTGSFEHPPIPGGELTIKSVKGLSEPSSVDLLNSIAFIVFIGLLILASLEVRQIDPKGNN